MEDATIIVACLVWVAIILLILFYMNLDKHRFRIRRMWKQFQPELDEWVALTGKIARSGGFAEKEKVEDALSAYQAAANAEGQSDAFSVLLSVPALPTSSGEAAQLLQARVMQENEMDVLFMAYNGAAAQVTRRLDWPFLGWIGRLMGFHRYPQLKPAKPSE